MQEPKGERHQNSAAVTAVILLGANIVAGALTPLGLSWLTGSSLSLAEGTTVALLTVLSLSAGELIYKVEQLYSLRRGEIEFWNLREGIDNTLVKIRTGLHSIVADPSLRDSFYLDHYSRELQLIESHVQTTIARKEIPLERHHIDSTKVLLSLFQSKKHNSFRATSLLSDIGDDFDVTFQIYFREWFRLINRKKVQVQRLFIYGDLSELSSTNARKLLAFHNQNIPGLEAKIINVTEFHRFKADYHITDGVDDIGIFSDAYIYLGRTRRGASIAGIFSRDRQLIDLYTSLFDALWNSHTAEPVTAFVQGRVDEDQLFSKSFVLPATSAPLQVTQDKSKEST